MPAHRHARESLASLTHRLRGQARRVTGPRQAVLEILRRQAHPQAIKQIHRALPPGECDLATVYRSMRMLEQSDMVQRFDFGDGIARYELIGDGDNAHHHHLVCTRCDAVVEIDDCFPDRLEKKIALRNGYTNLTHKLEFFGVCPGCQPA